jgi:phosphonate transport system substrate-binding protein
MPEVNDDDANAAMKVWAESIVQKGVVRADTKVLIFTNLAHLSNTLCRQVVDGVSVSTTEFVAVRQEVASNHLVFSVIGGDIYEEYVLLVRIGSPIVKAKDLKSHSLNVLRQSRTCLAPMWLDEILLESGEGPANEICGRINEETKLTQAVLPVFFGKVDACLATKKGFATMCELNPQLGHELRLVAVSPKLIPSVFIFRNGYPELQQQHILDELTHAHLTATGQQILTVFQTERLEEQPLTVLDGTGKFLTQYRQLVDRRRAQKTLLDGSGSPAVSGGNSPVADSNAAPLANQEPNSHLP